MARRIMAKEAMVLEKQETPVEKAPKTYTDWSVFDKVGLKLNTLICEGYHPYHPWNNGCHTTLIPKAENMKAHLDGDHGGGFLINLVHTDKGWAGWKDFERLGLEIMDFKCDVCDASLRLTPQTIAKHIKAHTGKNRRVKAGGDFFITLGYGRPETDEDESLG
jgi:hypothetical protein